MAVFSAAQRRRWRLDSRGGVNLSIKRFSMSLTMPPRTAKKRIVSASGEVAVTDVDSGRFAMDPKRFFASSRACGAMGVASSTPGSIS